MRYFPRKSARPWIGRHQLKQGVAGQEIRVCGRRRGRGGDGREVQSGHMGLVETIDEQLTSGRIYANKRGANANNELYDDECIVLRGLV